MEEELKNIQERLLQEESIINCKVINLPIKNDRGSIVAYIVLKDNYDLYQILNQLLNSYPEIDGIRFIDNLDNEKEINKNSFYGIDEGIITKLSFPSQTTSKKNRKSR